MNFSDCNNTVFQWMSKCDNSQSLDNAIEQCDIRSFYLNFCQENNVVLKTVSQSLPEFLKEYYPQFEIQFDSEQKLASVEDSVQTFTLLLHFSCVKYPEKLFQETFKKLPEKARKSIASIFKKLGDCEIIGKEEMRNSISNTTTEIHSSNRAKMLLEEYKREISKLKKQVEEERKARLLLEIKDRKKEQLVLKLKYDHNLVVQENLDFKNAPNLQTESDENGDFMADMECLRNECQTLKYNLALKVKEFKGGMKLLRKEFDKSTQENKVLFKKNEQLLQTVHEHEILEQTLEEQIENMNLLFQSLYKDRKHSEDSEATNVHIENTEKRVLLKETQLTQFIDGITVARDRIDALVKGLNKGLDEYQIEKKHWGATIAEQSKRIHLLTKENQELKMVLENVESQLEKSQEEYKTLDKMFQKVLKKVATIKKTLSMPVCKYDLIYSLTIIAVNVKELVNRNTKTGLKMRKLKSKNFAQAAKTKNMVKKLRAANANNKGLADEVCKVTKAVGNARKQIGKYKQFMETFLKKHVEVMKNLVKEAKPKEQNKVIAVSNYIENNLLSVSTELQTLQTQLEYKLRLIKVNKHQKNQSLTTDDGAMMHRSTELNPLQLEITPSNCEGILNADLIDGIYPGLNGVAQISKPIRPNQNTENVLPQNIQSGLALHDNNLKSGTIPIMNDMEREMKNLWNSEWVIREPHECEQKLIAATITNTRLLEELRSLRSPNIESAKEYRDAIARINEERLETMKELNEHNRKLRETLDVVRTRIRELTWKWEESKMLNIELEHEFEKLFKSAALKNSKCLQLMDERDMLRNQNRIQAEKLSEMEQKREELCKSFYELKRANIVLEKLYEEMRILDESNKEKLGELEMLRENNQINLDAMKNELNATEDKRMNLSLEVAFLNATVMTLEKKVSGLKIISENLQKSEDLKEYYKELYQKLKIEVGDLKAENHNITEKLMQKSQTARNSQRKYISVLIKLDQVRCDFVNTKIEKLKFEKEHKIVCHKMKVLNALYEYLIAYMERIVASLEAKIDVLKYQLERKTLEVEVGQEGNYALCKLLQQRATNIAVGIAETQKLRSHLAQKETILNKTKQLGMRVILDYELLLNKYSACKVKLLKEHERNMKIMSNMEHQTKRKRWKRILEIALDFGLILLVSFFGIGIICYFLLGTRYNRMHSIKELPWI